MMPIDDMAAFYGSTSSLNVQPIPFLPRGRSGVFARLLPFLLDRLIPFADMRAMIPEAEAAL
jgi:hypothetical protein